MPYFETNPDMPEYWVDHVRIKNPSRVDPRKDYVDITPDDKSVITAQGRPHKQEASLGTYEKREAMFNLRNLTYEGVLKKIELWLNSSNKYVLEKYKYMLKNCQRFAKSGQLTDGRFVFSRDTDDKPRWVGTLDTQLLITHKIIKKPKGAKEDNKESLPPEKKKE